VLPIGELLELELEPGVVLELELDVPLPDSPDVLPVVPLLEVEVSAPGAGVGDGAVVVEGVEAGGGVTTFSSFLLQAVRPIATRATTRSERFIFFSFRRGITRIGPENKRTAARAAVRERPTRSSSTFYQLRAGGAYGELTQNCR
jgi:hypothetical protein